MVAPNVKGTAMPDKGSDFGSKAATTLAGAVAAFVAEDPDVAIGEALAWTVVLGIGVAVARVLAVRLVNRQPAGRLPAAE